MAKPDQDRAWEHETQRWARVPDLATATGGQPGHGVPWPDDDDYEYDEYDEYDGYDGAGGYGGRPTSVL